MTRVRARGERVRKFILENIEAHPHDVVRVAAEAFGISRQATHRHLHNLVDENAISFYGNTRNRIYRLAQLAEWQDFFHLEPALTEDIAWSSVSKHLGPLPENVRNIWHYGFTEMFNNAIDHSVAEIAHVQVRKTAVDTEVSITDFGVGIFRKIQSALHLADERHSVLELAKGKFTTDPKNHSGEGIFFASRTFDDFRILSGKVFFSHKFMDEEDWILGDDNEELTTGTRVTMRLNNHTARTTTQIFDKYADVDLGFTKTVVPVRLAK